MPFDLNIKNIGKLADEKVRIGQFTVFAGPNNTGKSTVSKLLYSFFGAMNANHAAIHMINLTASLFASLKHLEGRSEEMDSLVSPLLEKVEKMHHLVEKLPIGDIGELNTIIPELVKITQSMRAMFSDTRLSLELFQIEMEGDLSPSLSESYINDVEQSLARLEKKISDADAGKFIAAGIQYQVGENLIQNFQVPNLFDLRGKEEVSSNVDIRNFGKFEFSNDGIDFEAVRSLPGMLQQFSNVLYLESPVYWKLKNALENLFIYASFSRRRKRIGRVPGYFYDLINALKHEYTGDIAFPDLYKNLTSKDVLGGKIVMSEAGNLSFQENGRGFSLPITAMGVANLGILALLIERKVLDEDSFLFIDEPEAHLHPAWQVVMAETLFELAKGGVNVVIATHSADILKWLEVHVKQNPDDERMIALNKFSSDGVDPAEQDFQDKMAAIKQELTRPFADLYMKGL